MTNAFNKSIRLVTPTLAVLLLASITMTGCGNPEADKTTGPQLGDTDIENAVTPRPPSSIKSPILWPKEMDEGDSNARDVLEPAYKKTKPGPAVKQPDGLEYQDVEVGFGMSPSMNRMAMVHYTGYLADGTKFESSKDRGMPFSFIVGSGKVIKGFEEGIMGMKVGGRRKVVIPPSLGYGAEGHGGKIPPNSTLTYDIRLLSCDR